MRLEHGAAHGDVAPGRRDVQRGDVGATHEGHALVLAGGGPQAALALVRQPRAVLEQHTGGFQVAVGRGNVQRRVPSVRVHVYEPVQAHLSG